MGELMTKQELAEYLKVSYRTVSRLVSAGDIPFTRIGRQVRFKKSDVEVWRKKLERAS